jgi:hypothetical protein
LFLGELKGEDTMTHRRKRHSHWTDSLPDDMWTHEPKVHLYRRDHRGKAHYLSTYLALVFDYATVARDYGGGDYLYVVVRDDRILRKEAMAIEGDPIQSPRENDQRRL